MNSIASHVHFLLRHHNCVIVPGLGAFLCNYCPAHSDPGTPSLLLPPGRRLAFNAMLADSDGMLALSISRQLSIPFDEALRRIQNEVEHIRAILASGASYDFGVLGRLSMLSDGRIIFSPASVPSINGPLFSYRPVTLKKIQLQSPPVYRTSHPSASAPNLIAEVPAAHPHSVGHKIRAYASAIAAAVAVIITVALWSVGPITTGTPITEASLAPSVSAPVSIPMPDSDSIEAPRTIHVALPANCSAATDTVAIQSGASVAKTITNLSVNNNQRLEQPGQYLVIVASFPTREQAESFIASSGQRDGGIISTSGRFRVYAASADSYAEANHLKQLLGQDDAWVCHR